MGYKFAVMMTKTTHHLKEIEIEADNLDAAKVQMERATYSFDTKWRDDRRHLIVGDIDHGCVADWPSGGLTETELRELCPRSDHVVQAEIDPTTADVYRVDWFERLTPEQIAQEAIANQAWLDDPEAQARYGAFKGAIGLPDKEGE